MFSKEDKGVEHFHRLRDTIVTSPFQAIHRKSQTITSPKLENGTPKHHAQNDHNEYVIKSKTQIYSSKSDSMTHHQTNIHSPRNMSVDISNAQPL